MEISKVGETANLTSLDAATDRGAAGTLSRMRPEDALPQLIERRADGNHGDSPFIEEVDGLTLTYRETHRAALAAARFYGQELGVVAEEPVAVMLPTVAESVITWLALGWLRAIELQVNTQLRGKLLTYVLENSDARVLITAERYLPVLAEVLPTIPNIERVVVVDGSPGDEHAFDFEVSSGPPLDGQPADIERGPAPYDIASVLYTSGTTGPSKGVILPWAHLHATASAGFPPADMTSEDAFYAPYAMYHITGKSAVYTTAHAGGRLVLRESFKTGKFWEDVERYRCTTTVLMGVMAQFLNAQPGPERLDTPLRNVMMAPLIPEVEAFKRRFGVRVRSCFNMTEISVPIVSPGWELPNAESCGRLRAGCQLRIVDAHDQDVPDGTVGELLVRNDDPWTLNIGYWRKPEATVAAWRNLWLHTGDAVRRDSDGNYYFVDRLKDSIRRRGENISSLELEREVLEYDGVAEAAAVGVAAEQLEDEIKVVVVPEAGREITPEGLCAFLEDRVPRYMVPRYVEIADGLPKTPTEKVRKTLLRDAGITATTWDRLAASRS